MKRLQSVSLYADARSYLHIINDVSSEFSHTLLEKKKLVPFRFYLPVTLNLHEILFTGAGIPGKPGPKHRGLKRFESRFKSPLHSDTT